MTVKVLSLDDRIAALVAQIATMRQTMAADEQAVTQLADSPAAEPEAAVNPPTPINGGLVGYVDRHLLLEAASTAMKAVNWRSPLPIMQHLLLEADGSNLTVTGSDLDTTIRVTVPTVGMSGRGLMPGKLLVDTLRSLTDENRVRLDVSPAGEGKVGPCVLRSGKVADWPKLTVPDHTDSTHVLTTQHGVELVAAVRAVLPAASEDRGRPLLMCVAFDSEADHLRLVATDSYRLAWYDTSLPFTRQDMRPGGGRHENTPTPWLVSAAVLKKVAALMLPDRVTFTGGKAATARFDGENITVVGRLEDGTFPNYRQLIPAQDDTLTRIEVPEEQLLAKLRILKPVVGDTVPIRLHYCDGGGLQLRAVRQDTGQAEVDVPESAVTGNGFAGGDLIAAFNLTYLREGVLAGRSEAKAKGGITRMWVKDPLKPAVIQVVGGAGFGGYGYLLMPVRI